MSDDFDPSSENSFSSFWPLLILVCGLLIWAGYENYSTNKMRIAAEQREAQYEQQLQSAIPTINEAQNIGNRYVALMKDLVQTAQKDPAAAAIVKDAIKANMISVQQNATNSPSAVAPTPTPAK